MVSHRTHDPTSGGFKRPSRYHLCYNGDMTTPGQQGRDRAESNRLDRKREQEVAVEESDDKPETLLRGVPDQQLDKPKRAGGENK